MGMVGERERSGRRSYGYLVIFVASLLALVMAGLPAAPARADAAPFPPPGLKNCGDGVTCTPPLSYHDGPVQHNPRIYLIFWGPDWSTQANMAVADDIIQSVASYGGTALNNVLTQYGDAAGNINNDVQLVDSAFMTDTLDDPQPGAILQPGDGPGIVKDALSLHATAQDGHPAWSNSDDTQFMIVLQPNAWAQPPFESSSCGFHSYDLPDNWVFSFIDFPGNTGRVSYCDSGGLSATDRMTWSAFHEYAEAATNPHITTVSTGTGWFTNDGFLNSGEQEVGDLCNFSDSDYQVWPSVWPETNSADPSVAYPKASRGYYQDNTGFTQELWSNEDNGCVYQLGEDGFVPDGTPSHTVSPPMEALYDAYAWNGSTPSVPGWGYPTTEQVPISGGLLQKFSQGAEYYQASTGLTYELQGPINDAYTAFGGPSSFLGWPTSDLFTDTSGIEENTFAGSGCGATGSAIIYDPGVTQPEEMHGCIYNAYVLSYGGLNGEFGAPMTGELETPSNDGRMERMSGTVCGSKSGSALYYDGTTYPVKGCFYQTYLGLGETNSLLGYPTSTEYSTSAGVKQNFQRGWMLFTSSGVQVGYNANYYAAGVTVVNHNTTACPGSAQSQYFMATDANSQPIDWTYANGSQQCINVNWAISSPATSCHYDIYVPAGHATGTLNLTIGALTGTGNPHYYTVQLNENPVSGWQSLTDNTNVFSIRFGDNNGQSYPTELGWGSAQKDGVRQIC
jgi:hypothetical protein